MAGSDTSRPLDAYAGRFVQLRGGLVVPADAFMLLMELEGRGFSLDQEGDSTLVVQPPDQLTSDDCTRIRRWKWHLLALLRYAEQGDVGAHLFDDRPAPVAPASTRGPA